MRAATYFWYAVVVIICLVEITMFGAPTHYEATNKSPVITMHADFLEVKFQAGAGKLRGYADSYFELLPPESPLPISAQVNAPNIEHNTPFYTMNVTITNGIYEHPQDTEAKLQLESDGLITARMFPKVSTQYGRTAIGLVVTLVLGILIGVIIEDPR